LQDIHGNKSARFGNLNTTEWFEKADAKLKERDALARLIAFILYSDKVSMGWGNQATAEAVMATLGNYSDRMQRKDCAKMCLGFIDAPNISDTVLIKHLMSLPDGKKMSFTKATDEVSRHRLMLF
jgi:hypothetical protein